MKLTLSIECVDAQELKHVVDLLASNQQAEKQPVMPVLSVDESPEVVAAAKAIALQQLQKTKDAARIAKGGELQPILSDAEIGKTLAEAKEKVEKQAKVIEENEANAETVATVQVAEITDDQLRAAIKRFNIQENKERKTEIQAIAKKHGGNKLAEIPQENRQAFLDEINAIKL